MTAEDDPEARIRELERPLSDLAAAAEFQTAPRGSGRRITVAIGAMVGLFAVVAGVAVYLITGGPTSTTPGQPTVPSAAAPTPAAPPAPQAPLAPSSPVDIAAPGRTVAISGAGENKTVVCNDGYVTASGVSNTVQITGQCAGVTVSGVGNVITVDATATITASGLNNRVTYRSGDPRVSISGFDNVVERG